MKENFFKIKPCKKIDTFDQHKNPNGWVLEVVSDRDRFTKHITGQVYTTMVPPGSFKGYHLHAVADYFITCIKGQIVDIIYRDKDTKEEVEMGDGDFKTIFIPKGHPHGIKNIGKEPAHVLIYRYPAWVLELKEQLDISPEDIEKVETWIKIEEFKNKFK